MLAENIYNIAIHLSEKEMEKLCSMLEKRRNDFSINKKKKKKYLSNNEAIDYLLKNTFSKKH